MCLAGLTYRFLAFVEHKKHMQLKVAKLESTSPQSIKGVKDDDFKLTN